jgi:hypothetical protein
MTMTATAVLASGESIASAQSIPSLAATNYFIDYSRHAHAYVEDKPLVPDLAQGSAWMAVHNAVMGGRRGSAMYLVGDDRMHLFPTRVGILGWGLSAGLQF